MYLNDKQYKLVRRTPQKYRLMFLYTLCDREHNYAGCGKKAIRTLQCSRALEEKLSKYKSNVAARNRIFRCWEFIENRSKFNPIYEIKFTKFSLGIVK